MHLPYAIEEVLPFYCKSFATMPQKQCSVTAKAMQRHCKGDTASLQKHGSNSAKAMRKHTKERIHFLTFPKIPILVYRSSSTSVARHINEWLSVCGCPDFICFLFAFNK